MTTRKTNVVVIHGGEYWKPRTSYELGLRREKVGPEDFKKGPSGWKNTLATKLGKTFEVFNPRMPLGDNARYIEWKIWFEKLIPFLSNDLILIGHSLGGIFLAKYLSENKIPLRIRALFLVGAPYDPQKKGSKKDPSQFTFKPDFRIVQEQVKTIFIYHSKNDPLVSYTDALQYQKLLPQATLRTFTDQGHFLGQNLPAIIRDIKKL